MEEKSFLEICTERYPEVNFMLDRPAAWDSNDVPYITIVIGGNKIEGDGFSLLSTLSINDYKLWEHWWNSFDTYVKGCYEVRIRREPVVHAHSVQELDSFSYELPTLVTKIYTQISGRFSFYKIEVKESDE